MQTMLTSIHIRQGDLSLIFPFMEKLCRRTQPHGQMLPSAVGHAGQHLATSLTGLQPVIRIFPQSMLCSAVTPTSRSRSGAVGGAKRR